MRIIYITFEDVGKAIKFNCALCAAGEKVTFDCFKFEIFHSCKEVLVAHLKVINSPSFSCGPLGAIWPSENHCSEEAHL